jgi:mono/diheme cytochrome c family protein/cytochrome c5
MKKRTASSAVLLLALLAAASGALVSCGGMQMTPAMTGMSTTTGMPGPLGASDLVTAGRQIFRFDTFGDEAFWTDTLRMHEPIARELSPRKALAAGLKVDAEALPAALVADIKAGKVDLDSPATTLALLKLDAVVGVKGTVQTVNGVDRLVRVGTTCALCHSTVDDSFSPGIGKRLDGWANRDLDPGAIIAMSPALDAQKKAAYNSWGKGKYDPRFNQDGVSKPVVIPPAYGLAGVNKITFTGDGDDIAYWNRYVSVTQMGGRGSFVEPRTGVSVTHGTQDLVSSKLPALQAYQLSLAPPPPRPGSFDAAAAARGRTVFAGAGRCASCHSGATFTDANLRLHPPSDSMAEPERPSYAARSATRMYRVSPLRGAWQHPPYFHDGSAASLDDVVATYNRKRGLGLSAQDVRDLSQYLRSL